MNCLSQPLVKAAEKMLERFGRAAVQKPYNRYRCLLRPHGSRPRDRCAPEERDEFAAVHSMTSSARASNCAGTSMPSAFAVFKLMSRLNFVGSTTGKSPFRTRPI